MPHEVLQFHFNAVLKYFTITYVKHQLVFANHIYLLAHAFEQLCNKRFLNNVSWQSNKTKVMLSTLCHTESLQNAAKMCNEVCLFLEISFKRMKKLCTLTHKYNIKFTFGKSRLTFSKQCGL